MGQNEDRFQAWSNVVYQALVDGDVPGVVSQWAEDGAYISTTPFGDHRTLRCHRAIGEAMEAFVTQTRNRRVLQNELLSATADRGIFNIRLTWEGEEGTEYACNFIVVTTLDADDRCDSFQEWNVAGAKETRRNMMNANETIQAEVLNVIGQLTEKYKNRDLDGLMNLVAADDDLFMFGTNIDERRQGQDEFERQAERDWSQTEALAFNFTWHRVSAAGPVAWVASEGVGVGKVGGQEIEFPLRMTTVLENQNDEWRIRLSHFSLPSPGAEEGSSVPA
jgi:ketosteroid isomerase-like protein